MKYYLKILMVWVTIFLGCQPAFPQTFPSNTIKFGDGTNTDKKITANKGGSNPQLRYNATAGSWQFTNDGTNFSDFGSGSGGGGAGINLISKNPDFEQGIGNGWANTGGTFAAVSSGSNLLFGKGSATFAASSTGQFVQSDLYSVPVGLAGKNCLARVSYKGGNTTYLLKVVDSSAALIASQAFPLIATETTTNALNFPCPSAGTQIRLRVESTSSAPIMALDRTHLGEADNLFQFSQASIVGTGKIIGSACNWITSQTTYAADFSAAPAGCELSSLTGQALAPATNIPAIRFAYLPPGSYYVVMKYSWQYNATNPNPGWTGICDGTSCYSDLQGQSSAGGSSTFVTTNTASIDYAVGGPRTFSLRGRSTVAGNTGIFADVSSGGNFEVEVFKYPSAPLQGFLPETTNWHIDANIGAGSNTPLSLSSVTSWTGIEGSDKDMILNSGSLPAQIPCAGTQPATGLTCGGGADESLGVAFDLPAAGKVEVCFDYTHVVASASGGNTTFQAVQTGNADQTPVLFGNQRTHDQFQTQSLAYPYHTCGMFEFPTAGKKTVRLMYQQNVGGYSANDIITDRAGGGLGGRDMHVTVRPVTQNVPYPVLIGPRVTTREPGEVKMCGGVIAGGGASMTWTVGDCGTMGGTVSNLGTGHYQMTFGQAFTGVPVCTCSPVDTNTNGNCNIYNYGNPAMEVGLGIAGAASNIPATVICIGVK